MEYAKKLVTAIKNNYFIIKKKKSKYWYTKVVKDTCSSLCHVQKMCKRDYSLQCYTMRLCQATSDDSVSDKNKCQTVIKII